MLLRFFCLLSLVVATILCIPVGAFDTYTWLWMLPVLAIGVLVILIVLAFGFLCLLAAVVDLKKPQQRDSKLYRKMVELYLDAALPVIRWDVKTKGMEKVPAQGRFMVVSNHVALADPVVMLHIFAGRQLAFISKKENQSMFLVGKVMHKLLCQPIDRENDREALKTILRCVEILNEDKASIGVFPEGYIHKDKKLHHFRPGVFKIAQKTQVPIVVCTLKGTRDAISNLLRYKRSDIQMSVIGVIQPEEYAGLPTTDIAQRIYEMMAQDLGPENVSQEENA